MRLLVFLLVLLAAAPARAERQRDLALRALRSDPSHKVRTQAAIVLGQDGAPDVIPALAEAATRDSAPAVRVAAIGALGRIGGPEARAAIEAARRDPDPSVRAAAEKALGAAAGPARGARTLAFSVEEPSGEAGDREARAALRAAIERHLRDQGHAIVPSGGAWRLKPSVVKVDVSNAGGETVIAVKTSLVAVDGAGRMELLESGARLRASGDAEGPAASRYTERALEAAARTLCDELFARLR